MYFHFPARQMSRSSWAEQFSQVNLNLLNIRHKGHEWGDQPWDTSNLTSGYIKNYFENSEDLLQTAQVDAGGALQVRFIGTTSILSETWRNNVTFKGS